MYIFRKTFITFVFAKYWPQPHATVYFPVSSEKIYSRLLSFMKSLLFTWQYSNNSTFMFCLKSKISPPSCTEYFPFPFLQCFAVFPNTLKIFGGKSSHIIYKSWILKLMEKPRDLVRNHKSINIWLRQFGRSLRANNWHDITTAILFPHHTKCVYELLSLITKAVNIKFKAQ